MVEEHSQVNRSRRKECFRASEVRIKLLLECTECKRRNYATEKNKRNTTSKLELKKYCPWCDKHTVHKEVKI